MRDRLSTLSPRARGGLAGWREPWPRPPSPVSQGTAKGEQMTCALRALTLCDGQVLEHPDRALTMCLCEALRAADGRCSRASYAALHRERQELIEKTLTAPPLPL